MRRLGRARARTCAAETPHRNHAAVFVRVAVLVALVLCVILMFALACIAFKRQHPRYCPLKPEPLPPFKPRHAPRTAAPLPRTRLSNASHPPDAAHALQGVCGTTCAASAAAAGLCMSERQGGAQRRAHAVWVGAEGPRFGFPAARQGARARRCAVCVCVRAAGGCRRRASPLYLAAAAAAATISAASASMSRARSLANGRGIDWFGCAFHKVGESIGRTSAEEGARARLRACGRSSSGHGALHDMHVRTRTHTNAPRATRAPCQSCHGPRTCPCAAVGLGFMIFNSHVRSSKQHVRLRGCCETARAGCA